ncbi:MAG: hypothetical protein U5J83_18635 [Bryobacterales bacterium]|nr:hypothetical protein [Bryobacterales bacterium]
MAQANQVLGNPNMSYDQLLRLVYYNSGEVPMHRVRYNAVYDLPFGKGRAFAGNASGFVNSIIGGWQLTTIGEWRSGNWLSVDASRYLFGDPTLAADERLPTLRPASSAFGLREISTLRAQPMSINRNSRLSSRRIARSAFCGRRVRFWITACRLR